MSSGQRGPPISHRTADRTISARAGLSRNSTPRARSPTPGFLCRSPAATVKADGTQAFTAPFLGVPAGIAVDTEHDIYVAMNALQADLPVTLGAFQPKQAGTDPFVSDVYVAKLDPTASGLLAATYLGG